MTEKPFESAESYLDSLGVDAMRSRGPSMHRIEAVCETLDHPERSIPSIHVAGTNGKSSTARIATSVLAATGLSVGTYTSPHLTSVRERISLSGDPISEDGFEGAFEHLWPYLQVVEKELEEKLSYFEVLTAMFFLWAVETPVDVMVVEVGLGGRWDATNVVPAHVGVLTNVGLDHTGLLGSERETIALEKSGIAKHDSILVTGERDPSVLEVIASEAAKVGATMSTIERDFAVTDDRVALGGRYLSVRTSARSYDGMFLALHGSHQATNAAIALEATARLFAARPLDQEVVQEGLGTIVAPGRFEVFGPAEGEGATVVLDVAHNPDGVAALISGLTETLGFDHIKFVFGVLGDKDFKGMLSELARLPCSLYLAEPKSARAVPVAELRAAAQQLDLDCVVASDVGAALEAALHAAADGDLVCVTGSHYVVGEARDRLVG